MVTAFALLLAAIGAAEGDPATTYGPPAPAAPAKSPKAAVEPCRSQDSRDIVICAQRKQELRLDSDVVAAHQQAEKAARSATATMPAAQANCSASPRGCGTGLEGLDLANVALVVATTAIKAAKGEDWTRVLKPGGPGEYQLYLQAKEEREAREEEARAEAAAKAAKAKR
jgi:hypothetical protein